MTALRRLPVAEITSGNDSFFCEPYSCTMLASACVARRVRVRAGVHAITFAQCKGCALGAVVEQNSGVKLSLKIHRPKYGCPSIRTGKPIGRGPRVLELTRDRWLSYEEIAAAVGAPKGLTGTINQLRVTHRLEHRVEQREGTKVHLYRALPTDIDDPRT